MDPNDGGQSSAGPSAAARRATSSSFHESKSTNDLAGHAEASNDATQGHAYALNNASGYPPKRNPSLSVDFKGQAVPVQRPASTIPAVNGNGNEQSDTAQPRLLARKSQPVNQSIHPRPSLDNYRTNSGASGTLSPPLSTLSLPSGKQREPSDPTNLLRVQHGVVKGRSGTVLGRGFILKNDRLPPRNTHPLEFSLKGAPNFRPAGGEKIYGSAQPSITGLRTVLSVLGCQSNSTGRVVWICTREEPVIYIGGSPFVLRDAESPLVGYSISDRAEALESIERRLKNDILREAQRYGGVVQVQEEHAASISGTPQISSQWIAASPSNVMTIRELCRSLQEEGFGVDYHRIAISSDENPENQYLDNFLEIVRNVDPKTALYFNDGVGVVRATFAMTMALLVRRHKATLAAQPDSAKKAHSRSESVIDRNVQRHLLAEANAITKRNRSLIRLTAVLNNSIPSDNQAGIMNGLLTQPQILENLRMAVEGDYDLILNLLSCLDTGSASKSLADAAIDQCEAVLNLREEILAHRVKLAMVAMDDEHRDLHYRKAASGLERYFFLVAFANYIAETENKPDTKYSTWIEVSMRLCCRTSLTDQCQHATVQARNQQHGPTHAKTTQVPVDLCTSW
jgi:hypothetical protein